MQLLRTSLLAVLVTGCGAGVSSDPSSSRSVGPLTSAPRTLLAHVLTSSVLTSGAENDATYLAMVEEPGAGQARLIKQDLRDTAVQELDRMPLGEGAAQIALGGDGIVWGFGGKNLAAGTFRIVRDGAGRDIAFGDRAPTWLFFEDSSRLTYASSRDCAVEQLDLTTGGTTWKGQLGCYTTIESVIVAGSAFMRTDDDPGKTIRQMDVVFAGSTVVGTAGMASAVGPFSASLATDWPARVAWIGPDGEDSSRVYTAGTDLWPAVVEPGQRIGGSVDAAAYVDRELWGATLGSPATLFHVAGDEVIRYDVDYQPRSMLGLHKRLLIETADGELLDQPISSDE